MQEELFFCFTGVTDCFPTAFLALAKASSLCMHLHGTLYDTVDTVTCIDLLLMGNLGLHVHAYKYNYCLPRGSKMLTCLGGKLSCAFL